MPFSKYYDQFDTGNRANEIYTLNNLSVCE